MDGVLEFHGRLARSDRRPANPGAYSLLFQLHGHSRTGSKRDKVYWEETLDGVQVTSGGFYRVVLGRSEPMPSKIFDVGPRWMSVQVIRSGRLDAENGARIPLLGQELALRTSMGRIMSRLERLEEAVTSSGKASTKVEAFHTRLKRIAEAMDSLDDRISECEDPATLDALIRRWEVLTTRVDEVDRDDGRLDRVELEMEDLVGPDGDVVDLNDRMDRIEGRAPELIAHLRERERSAPQQRLIDEVAQDVEALQSRIEALDLAIATVLEANQGRGAALPSPGQIGAVARGGDAMTGGLTINRGGLKVLSGGISCRGATVTSLEASNQIKAPKAILDSVELRGDMTVDSASRVLQVRHLEGRQSSARRDGSLHLNARSGGEVVVGTEKAARGLSVHGAVRADQLGSTIGNSVAQMYSASGDLQAADVVRVNDDGSKVQRVRKAFDSRVIGVVTDLPGLLLGGPQRSGAVAVALQGVVPCRVEAEQHPIRAGDLLTASRVVGHGRRVDPESPPAPGTVFGKALAPLATGRGIVSVLLGGS